jgi:sugar O-acyltransferase (sialic acid O-acetyltransferase NeuD family)
MTQDPRPIVIVGAGELAEIAYEYFTDDSPRTVEAFSVPAEFLEHDSLCGLPVVPFEELGQRYPPRECQAFVAISSTQLNRVRRRMYEAVGELGYACASYVSSRAFLGRNVSVGQNTFVFEDNVLQRNVRVGNNVILWSGNHVGHGTSIGDHCFLTSHVVVAGFCTVGPGSFLGANCSVNDKLTIGADCVIGAGAVVIRDTDERGVYVGNPARETGSDSFATFGVEGS